MPESREGSLSFSIDARHVQQLGRELVADRITAVSELIKNAYDADATEVTVTFDITAADDLGANAVITDDGVGMTLEDIESRWMVISTNNKDVNSVSTKYERLRAGQKGIGRFATESLGTRLVMKSTVEGSTDQVVVEFDWGSYPAGVRLDEVTNPYHFERVDASTHGTELHIEGLRHTWDSKSLTRIREAVLLLQPPFEREDRPAGEGPQGDPGFRVSVRYESDTGEAPPSGDIGTIRSAATAWIEGTVDQAGTVRRHLRSPHLDIDERETIEARGLIAGPLTFQIAYFVFKRDALNPEGSIGVRRAQELATKFGGVRLYRDGLRILPYGEPGNDWLGLDAIYRRRGQILAPIGNTNVFGEVLVTREENVLLVDTASREGVVENQALDELKSILRDALIWGVNKVAAVRQRKLSASRSQHRPESREELIDRLANAAERVAAAGNDADRDAAVAQVIAAAEEARTEARRSDRVQDEQVLALLDELSLLRVLASAGSAIAVFSHEVRAVLSQSLGAIADVADLAESAGLDGSELEVAETGLQGISDLASYLDLYVSQSGRRTRQEQPLHEVLGSFASSVEPLLLRRGVQITTDVSPAHLRTAPMSRSELQAVLYNLLTNALRALDHEGLTQRRIRLRAHEEGSSAVIDFSDTGVGIDDRVRDRIFEAFVTTTEESDAELGAGTGLGLKIVADVAEVNGGSVAIGPVDEEFATTIRVRLPKWIPDAEEPG